MVALRVFLFVCLMKVLKADNDAQLDTETLLEALVDYQYNNDRTINSLEAVIFHHIDAAWQDNTRKIVQIVNSAGSIDKVPNLHALGTELFDAKNIFDYVMKAMKSKSITRQENDLLRTLKGVLCQHLADVFKPFQNGYLESMSSLLEYIESLEDNGKLNVAISTVIEKVLPGGVKWANSEEEFKEGTNAKFLQTSARRIHDALAKYFGQIMGTGLYLEWWMDFLFRMYEESLVNAMSINTVHLDTLKELIKREAHIDREDELYQEVRMHHLQEKLCNEMLESMKITSARLQQALRYTGQRLLAEEEDQSSPLSEAKKKIKEGIFGPLQALQELSLGIFKSKYEDMPQDEKDEIISNAKSQFNEFKTKVEEIAEEASHNLEGFISTWKEKITKQNTIQGYLFGDPEDCSDYVENFGGNISLMEYECTSMLVGDDTIRARDILLYSAFNHRILRRLSENLEELLNLLTNQENYHEIKKFTDVIKQRKNFPEEVVDRENSKSFLQWYTNCMDGNILEDI